MLIRLLIVLLSISLVANALLLFRPQNSPSVPPPSSKQGAEQYSFLAKRIFVEDPNDVVINFIDLRHDLRAYTADLDDKIGIYFEYLPTGTRIGINDRKGFRRASLVKIPAVMRIYKLIEEGKVTKQDKLTLTKELLDSRYGDLWKRGEGTEITVEEAIRLTLTESDNTAFNLLRAKIDQTAGLRGDNNEDQLLQVYDYLDVERDETGQTLDISPRGFSSILKSLYFSAYLSYASSNEILATMTNTLTPYNLLETGSPSDTKIAHKYGVNRDGSGENLLTSDCGIFYYPKRQYILCIMANLSPEVAGKHFTAISKMVYDFVKNANTAK